MNKVILIGRLTKDPELRFTPNGKAVATFSLAVDRSFKREGQPTADFFRVVVWGKQAENCANYLGKGRMVAVDGRIENGSYEKEGQKHYTTDIIAEGVKFLDKGDKNESGSSDSSGFQEDMGLRDLSEDDLPF